MSHVRMVPVDVAAGELPLYVEILSEDRDELAAYLEHHGVQTRPFLPNLDRSHHLTAGGYFPHASEFEAKGLFLPSGPRQPLENADRVLELLHGFARPSSPARANKVAV